MQSLSPLSISSVSSLHASTVGSTQSTVRICSHLFSDHHQSLDDIGSKVDRTNTCKHVFSQSDWYRADWACKQVEQLQRQLWRRRAVKFSHNQDMLFISRRLAGWRLESTGRNRY
ncbi:unnamed protein product [Protopolystoma xenopodis]|uniref:Uncharacterized protein n=1 Tax=Protopolystoma xenopodis TaxID=117903 RepID=A0A3S5BAJ8_9PLAT|nr:unnamed protein product [Protopolystoma xenopodis]